MNEVRRRNQELVNYGRDLAMSRDAAQAEANVLRRELKNLAESKRKAQEEAQTLKDAMQQVGQQLEEVGTQLKREKLHRKNAESNLQMLRNLYMEEKQQLKVEMQEAHKEDRAQLEKIHWRELTQLRESHKRHVGMLNTRLDNLHSLVRSNREERDRLRTWVIQQARKAGKTKATITFNEGKQVIAEVVARSANARSAASLVHASTQWEEEQEEESSHVVDACSLDSVDNSSRKVRIGTTLLCLRLFLVSPQ